MIVPGFAFASAISSGSVFAGSAGLRDQQLLQQHQHRHRDEVALRVEGQLGVEVRIDREGRVGRQQHRVAVRRDFATASVGEDGVRAGLVLHHHRLAPVRR